jgi:hypothetical protein
MIYLKVFNPGERTVIVGFTGITLKADSEPDPIRDSLKSVTARSLGSYR